MSLTKVTNSMISGAVVNVFDFMTPTQIASVQARNLTEDVTASINAAIASLGVSGTVRFPKGLYKTTSEIKISSGTFQLIGDGLFGGTGAYDQGATTIYAAHAGNSVLNLVGAGGCRVQDLCLQSGPPSGAFPQTGLMLGRTTAASSGYHHIERISIYGCYDAAAIYTLASEDNYWEDIYVNIYGGAAKYCLYTGIGKSGFPGITQSFYTSSNLTNTFNRFWFTNSSFNADSACIYIDGAEAVGSWSFFGGYMTASSGSYVEIANGYVDGLSMLGPITFAGCSGERFSGGNPLYGFKLTCSISGLTLPNLNIFGGRYDLQADTTHYLFSQSNNLILTQPNITLKPPEAFPYAQVVLYRDLIYGGTINLGRYAAWKTATLASGWSDSLSSPNPVASFMIDSTGRVHLRGTVTGGTGTIFTLPVGYRPVYTWRLPTTSNGAVALVTVDSSGAVALATGSATAVELGNLSFDLTNWTQA
jgi:hypothetical protein